ncbi:LysM peptidoglycan-binding domain-containing protein [Ornithinimicrobium sp. F0845]|uniref:LysM peptidoglycan-binding domain-containing protein n=1 Tax=Ornithinimicrobium sp. F0845 TaxID=2926412 RepID=UPI001FF4CB0D|nr:LysM domain-containing protein [Ornithinimicrobium sp. F0845]MCK0111687.1 LysM peptidoglycan-binding domain-containing protein [Ornithinimicrobium sp. F0845]
MSTVAERPPSLHIQASGMTLAARLLPTTRPRFAQVAAPRSGGREHGAPVAARTVTVRAGDTLSGIAAAHGVPVTALLSLNPGVRARGLQVGQHVILPTI